MADAYAVEPGSNGRSNLTLILAHRGASAVAPENTLLALQRAGEAGATWVEVDVRRCADGMVVLAHDDSWRRLAGRAMPVRALDWPTTAALQLRTTASPETDHPASLEGALTTFPDLRFDIELKEPALDPDLVGATLRVLRTTGAQHRVVLSSFDHNAIDALATCGGEFALAYIAQEPFRTPHPGVRTCALQADYVERDAGVVQRLQEQGVRVWCWTVDDVGRAQQLVRAGVDGIITNDPQRLRSLAPS